MVSNLIANKYSLEEILILLDQTLFYSESGGQSGDRGLLIVESGLIFVQNTIKKYKPDIFISIHKNYIKKIGQTDKQLFKLLNKINYQIKDSSGTICKYLENKEYFLSLK